MEAGLSTPSVPAQPATYAPQSYPAAAPTRHLTVNYAPQSYPGAEPTQYLPAQPYTVSHAAPQQVSRHAMKDESDELNRNTTGLQAPRISERSSKSAEGPVSSKWDEDQWDRILRAQLHVVNYLHLTLPISPCLFIVKRMNINFFQVYMDHRPRMVTVLVMVSAFLWTELLPCAFANTLMDYDCDKERVLIANNTEMVDGSVVTMQRRGCTVQDFLRDPKKMMWVGAPCLAALVAVQLGVQLYRLYQPESFLLRSIHHLLGPYMRNVFLGGLGAPSTWDSPFNFMNRLGRGSEYRWRRDMLGSELRVEFVFFQCLIIMIGPAVLGWWVNYDDARNYIKAALGALSGAAVGGSLARLSLPVMNYLLGAGPILQAAVVSELKSHQPLKHVTKGTSNAIDETKIRGAVDIALKMIDDWPDVQGKVELWRQVDKEGAGLLIKIASWLVEKYAAELVTNEGACWRLFECGEIFGCTESELVALSLLDMPLFLLSYFDDDWTVLGNIPHVTRPFKCAKIKIGWTRKMCLQHVYISNPNVKICKQDDMGKWKIDHVLVDRNALQDTYATFLGEGFQGMPDSNSRRTKAREPLLASQSAV